MGFFGRREVAVDFDDLEERLRAIPPIERPADEFAPRQGADYSIERVQSFLQRYIEECDQAEAKLADEEDAAKVHLAEVERRRDVTRIARDALSDTLANLTSKVAALDQHEGGSEKPAAA